MKRSMPAGAVSDRLRRVTKEIATLPGQLPLAWESGILVAMDEDRMDVLRVRSAASIPFLLVASGTAPSCCVAQRLASAATRLFWRLVGGGGGWVGALQSMLPLAGPELRAQRNMPVTASNSPLFNAAPRRPSSSRPTKRPTPAAPLPLTSCCRQSTPTARPRCIPVNVCVEAHLVAMRTPTAHPRRAACLCGCYAPICDVQSSGCYLQRLGMHASKLGSASDPTLMNPWPNIW